MVASLEENRGAGDLGPFKIRPGKGSEYKASEQAQRRFVTTVILQVLCFLRMVQNTSMMSRVTATSISLFSIAPANMATQNPSMAMSGSDRKRLAVYWYCNRN